MQIYNIRAEFIPVNFDIPAKLIDKTIQANGVYNASDDEADGYSSVTVVVPDRPVYVQELNITPSTQAQTIEIASGTDGYGPVNVSAVENVLPENIKQGETILGVQGSVVELNGEAREVTLTTRSNTTFYPTVGHNGMTSIKVTPNLQALNIDPATEQQTFFSDSGYSGFGRVIANPVTSAIDANIQAGNIKEGVTILGTTGNIHVPEYYIEKYKNNKVLQNRYLINSLEGIEIIGDYALAYAGAKLSTPTQVPDLSGIKRVYELGMYSMFYSQTYNSNVTGVVNLSSLQGNDSTYLKRYALAYAFANTGITEINIGNMLYATCEESSLSYLCYGCTALTKVDLHSLIRVGSARNILQYAFSGCTSLTDVNLTSLTCINVVSTCYGMFQNCTSLQTIDLNKLVAISGVQTCQNMFSGCTALSNVILSSLKCPGEDNRDCTTMFQGCTSLTSLSFPALRIVGKSSIQNLISGVTGCTLHFPKNLDPQSGSTVISSLTSYPNFGGTNTVLAFDLPSTNILTGVDTKSYERNPRYDTENALAWRVQDTGTIYNPSINWTPYYTSGLTDPTVGTTIYSDAECTTAVTTVDSIA